MKKGFLIKAVKFSFFIPISFKTTNSFLSTRYMRCGFRSVGPKNKSLNRVILISTSAAEIHSGQKERRSFKRSQIFQGFSPALIKNMPVILFAGLFAKRGITGM
jgi:hypothetical protein